MDRISRRRYVAIFLCIFLIMGLFSFRLFKLQGEDLRAAATGGTTLSYTTTVYAARGRILDRNGNVLVSNRACYDLTIANLAFFSGGNVNEKLRTLLEKCDSLGDTVSDGLPISLTGPYTYDEEASYTQKSRLTSYLRWRDWDPEMSAKNLLARMKTLYDIPEEWDESLQRRVTGLRYELDLRYCVGLSNFVLLHDVSTEVLATVLEIGIPGISAEASTVREYNTQYAAHILGSIGPIYAEEWESYKALGYSMDALVGKEGLERAFEEYLHGENGTMVTVIDENGELLESYYTKEPVPGNDVYLTIDLTMQAAAEDALEKTILDLRENGVGLKKEGKDAVGGAVVAIDCKTGEVLTSGSYPSFDITTYNQYYNQLLADETGPLKNRALTEVYNPGSIYKMVTAIAAVDEDNASRWRQITDRGVYTYYQKEGYTCNCHIWTSSGTTHGTIDMMEALSCSCNYYFYEVGREAGITALDKVAKGLGLGEKTGVEVYEAAGIRANPETRAQLYANTDSATWYGADTLQASIGQSDNAFTPIQMASYCATLANGGVRMQATFLSQVVSQTQGLICEQTPVVASSYDISTEALTAIREGMVMAASEGTANTYLKDFPIPVAGKTGTAQHGTGGSDNCSFICYAPADDPQIAIAIYVEKGAQGGNLGQIARAMLEAYFGTGEILPEYSIENIPQ